MKCCRWGWLVRSRDTPDEARMKQMGFPFAMSVFLLSAAILVWSAFEPEQQMFFVVGVSICACTAIIFMVGVSTNFIPVAYLVDQALLLCVVACCLLDIANAAVQGEFRSWALFILALDGALVFRRDHMLRFIIPIVLLHTTLISIESFRRFGLYEAGYLGMEPDGRFACASPPCARTVSEAVIVWSAVCIVFLGDFHFTRGFSNGMRLQLLRVEAAIAVAGEIVEALASYDVDRAETAIENGEHLPKELEDSYRRLVSNLRRFGAYLPHSCRLSVHADHTDTDNPEKSIFRSSSGAMPELVKVGIEGERGSDENFVPVSSGLPVTPIRRVRSTSPPEAPITPRAKMTHVSLAAGNMVGYLAGFGMEDVENRTWIMHDVTKWCKSVARLHGVVDLISGDRRFASFNASRRCRPHAAAAVEVLNSRGEGEWSGCVVSGQAVCGDYGSIMNMRFMILGAISSSLHVFERLAARWNIPALVDGPTYTLACCQWRGSLLGACLLDKRGVDPIRVYKITGRVVSSPSPSTKSRPSSRATQPSPSATATIDWLAEEEARDNRNVVDAIQAKLQEKPPIPPMALVTPLSEDGLGQLYEGSVASMEKDGPLWRLREVGLDPW
eukprot:Hpha_TRINITY_DN16601_c1_g4::TRINITY_DN16601_c1_g4_i1::g.180356::m.180356